MSNEEIHRAICQSLESAVPGVDLSLLDEKANLREELDIDSMDFLNFVAALHKQLGVSIPEADYQQLWTLKGAESYLESKLRTVG